MKYTDKDETHKRLSETPAKASFVSSGSIIVMHERSVVFSRRLCKVCWRKRKFPCMKNSVVFDGDYARCPGENYMLQSRGVLCRLDKLETAIMPARITKSLLSVK